MTLNKLNLFALLLIILGLLFLGLYSLFYNPPEINLLENNFDYLEKVVSVSGKLNNLTASSDNAFFNICNLSSCLSVVYFDVSKFNLDLLENSYLQNQSVKLTGKLILYNNDIELLLYKFEVLDVN